MENGGHESDNGFIIKPYSNSRYTRLTEKDSNVWTAVVLKKKKKQYE